MVRRAGIGALTGVVERAFETAAAEGVVLPAVEVVRDRVLVDITQTTSQDLHSGIQRVARECAGRWLAGPTPSSSTSTRRRERSSG